MRYCPQCGAPVERRWVMQEQHERAVCTSCGTIHYENPRLIVGCAVCWEDRILMCRRSQEPALGQWVMPNGFLECGETLEQGAARETFEETGVVIAPERLELYSVANMTALAQVAVMFRVQLDALPPIRPGIECSDVAFMSESEIRSAPLAWRDAMGNRPQRFFNELRSGEFTIQLIAIGSSDATGSSGSTGSTGSIGFKSREYPIRSAPTAPPRRRPEPPAQ
jgi:ADP-ribose pyrophosphatase YjhB (NUDIX family)